MREAINNNATLIIAAFVVLAFATAGALGVPGLESYTDTLFGVLIGGGLVAAKKSNPTP